MKKRFLCVALLLMLSAVLPAFADTDAADYAVYRIVDEQQAYLTSYCGPCAVGDEYLSEDNVHYRVTSVDGDAHTAVATRIGELTLPDVSWLDALADAYPVSASGGERKIALYCTHSDESYKPSDGVSSDEERGSIYQIAKELSGQLESKGVTVAQSDETHYPHDAGAYRRSRQTAVDLLKGTPDAIFDIHRDGIPDPDEYAATIGGTKMSRVRLLVGRGNQNKDANLSFAKQIKAVADKLYPKLIKDIYMGKGSYNQDLSPRSVLLEFGTYTLSKERVLASAKPMADAIYKALYGSVTGSAGASDTSGSASAGETAQGQQDDAKASGSGIVWMIVLLVVGLLVFAFVAAGRGGWGKFKRSVSEMTGGLVGKKPDKED